MACPLGLEFNSAVYHMTSLGNARLRIYIKDADGELFIDTLATCSLMRTLDS